MQLTTREAVHDALQCMASILLEFECGHIEHIKTKCAMQLLCDHYGFKISQFFDDQKST